MRHIPEEELHAYLDQALSRSQCVEIESHLADCPSCQALRDGIAALRDRTTALLARLAPPRRTVPPSLEMLRRRAQEAASVRQRRLHLITWAASLVVAVGLGWAGSSILGRGAGSSVAPRYSTAAPVLRPPAKLPLPEPAATPSRPQAAPLEHSVKARGGTAPRVRTAEMPRRARNVPETRSRDSTDERARMAALSVLDQAPAVELTPVRSPRANAPEFDGMWRTMSWDGAQQEAGEKLPHIDGLPVLQVQVQAMEGKRPVMVVAQQLASGQVIRTIEGPATDVSQLLSTQRSASDPDSVALRADSATYHPPLDQTMAMQLGDRMLAITGDLPSDSLRAMIRRLNAEMRSK